ncbi:MAG: VOC family protein [Myxococcota bacterium]
MVGYTTLGTSDLDRAIAFFDSLLGEFGAKQVLNDGRMVVWGKDFSKGMVAICKPFDGKPPSVGNGVMIALNMETPDGVEKLHAKALELGASDEGAPGERMKGFYGAYFRDLDGNKFCGFCMGA